MLVINIKNIRQILDETSYERVAGTENEFKCANYLVNKCKELGFEARLEGFDIRIHTQESAKLVVDGKEIECCAFGGTGSGSATGTIYCVEGFDDVSLENVKDKIVLCQKMVNIKTMNLLKEKGAKAFITINGNVNIANKDVLKRGFGNKTQENERIIGVNIHIKDAVKIVRKKKSQVAKISVKQTESTAKSYNVVVDVPGESEKYIILTAHYDSTQFSHGAFDNMSSCIGLLHILEYFKTHKRKLGIKIVFCGSEEIGLVGSRVYCRDHKDELCNAILNVNLDMLGCFMGRFTAFSCIDEKTQEFLKNFAKENNYPAEVMHSIRSSDQNPFLVNDVKAVSFARYPVADTGEIHTRYDTKKIVDAKQLYNDIDFVAKFCDFAVNNPEFFEGLEISEKIKTSAQESINKQRDLL